MVMVMMYCRTNPRGVPLPPQPGCPPALPVVSARFLFVEIAQHSTRFFGVDNVSGASYKAEAQVVDAHAPFARTAHLLQTAARLFRLDYAPGKLMVPPSHLPLGSGSPIGLRPPPRAPQQL